MSAASTAAVNGPRWGARAETWAALSAGITAPAWQVIADLAGIEEGTRVLDVACGSGEFCRLAAGRGAEVSGIDAAEGMIEVARRAVPRADIRVGPIETLPWDDRTFDVVTGFNAFQFAADTVVALREARRVVRPGGHVAVCQWDDRYPNEVGQVMAAVRELVSPGSSPPASPHVEESLDTAGLRLALQGDVDVPFELPDRDTLERALLAPGGALAAVERAGEDAVRATIVEAAEPFRRLDGSYRFENRFRYAIGVRA